MLERTNVFGEHELIIRTYDQGNRDDSFRVTHEFMLLRSDKPFEKSFAQGVEKLEEEYDSLFFEHSVPAPFLTEVKKSIDGFVRDNGYTPYYMNEKEFKHFHKINTVLGSFKENNKEKTVACVLNKDMVFMLSGNEDSIQKAVEHINVNRKQFNQTEDTNRMVVKAEEVLVNALTVGDVRGMVLSRKEYEKIADKFMEMREKSRRDDYAIVKQFHGCSRSDTITVGISKKSLPFAYALHSSWIENSRNLEKAAYWYDKTMEKINDGEKNKLKFYRLADFDEYKGNILVEMSADEARKQVTNLFMKKWENTLDSVCTEYKIKQEDYFKNKVYMDHLEEDNLHEVQYGVKRLKPNMVSKEKEAYQRQCVKVYRRELLWNFKKWLLMKILMY